MPGIIDIPNDPNFRFMEDRVGLNEHHEAQVSGQKPATLFGRIWDCLTRSNAAKDANRTVARQFVAELSAKYGNQVAAMASRQLKSQLAGSPLTVGRVMAILSHPGIQQQNRIAARNNALFDQHIEEIFTAACRKALCRDQPPDSIRSDALVDRMIDAITGDPDFSRRDYQNNPRAFIDHCTRIGQHVLEQAVLETMLPSTMALAHEELGENYRVAPGPELEKHSGLLGKVGLGMSSEQERAFAAQLYQMRFTAEMVAVQDPHAAHLPPDNEALLLLGFVGVIQDQRTGQGVAQPWAELQDLPEKAENLRRAMGSDLGELAGRLDALLGLNELRGDDKTVILSANTLQARIRSDIHEHPGRLKANLPDYVARLEAAQQQLTAIPAGGAKSARLIAILNQQCVEALDALRQLGESGV